MIVIDPDPVVIVEFANEWVAFDSAALAFCASSVFDVIFSSFEIFAVLFERMPDGAALYDSDVIAANGFGGG